MKGCFYDVRRSRAAWAAMLAVALPSGAVRAQSTPMVQMASTPDAIRAREVHCLAQAILYEAGLAPLEGRQAVAQVVMNRLRAPAYPKTVCGVVYQGSSRRTGCQFTFTCDGSLSRRISAASLADAAVMAEEALDGRLPDRVGEATHYHAYYVSPYWAPRLSKVGRIGAHIFYRGTGGSRPLPVRDEAAVNRPAPSTNGDAPFLPWGLSLAAFAVSTSGQ